VIEVDPILGDTEPDEDLSLRGEVLFVSGAMGISLRLSRDLPRHEV
jgi:hypothetical protein